MKVPFRLRKLPAAEPAAALMLPAPDVDAVLALCARAGTDPPPDVFAVADGFLVKLRRPTTAAFPGAVRLRGLAENLLLPVDAGLVPALHADEASALVRDRGLVFLPGGRVLAFAPREPLPLSALLGVEHIARRPWRALPAAPPRVERLQGIVLDLPGPDPEDLLAEGGDDIGTEAPRPDDAGGAAQVLSQAQLQAGRGMVRLGKLLGLPALARLGAQWMKNAVGRAPRLTEGILGRQEAALRALLREFREGSLERALRRALPLGHEADRGVGTPGTGVNLPFNNLLYSLTNLLGGGGGRGAGYWLGGYDVQAELIKEYRKAAEQAVQAGDYRRAAYIYGRLLRDYRQAANVLAQGGLHHDAALLYLNKIGDELAAARAFEAAGEVDRALQLYRQRGDHVLAGDLLRRLGEEDQAVLEYQRAAVKLAAARGGDLAAGELLLKRANRPDLAVPYFQAGWGKRPEGSALACGLHLARLYAAETPPDRLRGLLAEAGDFFGAPGQDGAAGQFCNEIARLAEADHLAGLRDDLRDWALTHLATKLRQRAELKMPSRDIVATLFGQSGAWAPAVVSDANHAWRAAINRPAVPPTPARAAAGVTSVCVGSGTVTAACFAAETGAVFLGFDNGDVASFRPSSGEVVSLPPDTFAPRGAAVTSLAADAVGRMVVVCRESQQASMNLSSYAQDADGVYQRQGNVFYRRGTSWLAPVLARLNEDCFAGLWDGDKLNFCRGPLLVYAGSVAPPRDHGGEHVYQALLLPGLTPQPRSPEAMLPVAQELNLDAEFRTLLASRPGSLIVLLLGPGIVWWGTFRPGEQLGPGHAGLQPFPCPWKSSRPEGSPLHLAPLAWLDQGAGGIELAGLGENGSVYWSALNLVASERPRVTNVSVRAEGYLAATLVRSRFVAGVARRSIDWLRCGPKQFTLHSATKVFLPSAVACFPSHPTHELLVVCRDGVVVRVPAPN
jgi:tetratricopeptide (TPR) repeat protein